MRVLEKELSVLIFRFDFESGYHFSDRWIILSMAGEDCFQRRRHRCTIIANGRKAARLQQILIKTIRRKGVFKNDC